MWWSTRCRSLEVPDYKVWMCLLHDQFLRADVLLLSRVHNVTLLQDLHPKRLHLIALELHLTTKPGELKLVLQLFICLTHTIISEWMTIILITINIHNMIKNPQCHNLEKNAHFYKIKTWRSVIPAQHGQILQRQECRWCWSQTGLGWRRMHSLPRICISTSRRKSVVIPSVCLEQPKSW